MLVGWLLEREQNDANFPLDLSQLKYTHGSMF